MQEQNPAGTMSEPGSAMQDAMRDPKAAADHVARQMSETLKSVADHARAQLPEGGVAGQVADAVTGGIKDAATRLQEEGFSGMIDDVVAIARRYPMQALALGLGCGYLMFRLRHD